MIIVLMGLTPFKIYINGDELTNDSRSLLTNKIIRQKAGGEAMFKMEKKMQNSVSIHKKDHAKTRSILIKTGVLATHLQHCRESTATCISWRKRRSHLTAAASGRTVMSRWSNRNRMNTMPAHFFVVIEKKRKAVTTKKIKD